jgi:hypothetical protein
MYGVSSSLFHPQSLSLSRISHIASVPKQHVPYVLCVEHHQTSWDQLGVWFSESACVCPHTQKQRLQGAYRAQRQESRPGSPHV